MQSCSIRAHGTFLKLHAALQYCKTSAQTPSQDKAVHLHETQLSCYALMYREATGHREGGLEIHHLIKLKQPKIMVTVMDPMTLRLRRPYVAVPGASER